MTDAGSDPCPPPVLDQPSSSVGQATLSPIESLGCQKPALEPSCLALVRGRPVRIPDSGSEEGKQRNPPIQGSEHQNYSREPYTRCSLTTDEVRLHVGALSCSNILEKSSHISRRQVGCPDLRS
ncbi:hypothetical protein LIA77_01133 [Sarocladium implicatum]|nr:hypothetical protein LIA77_01133 [Sarocladium implicatum]